MKPRGELFHCFRFASPVYQGTLTSVEVPNWNVLILVPAVNVIVSLSFLETVCAGVVFFFFLYGILTMCKCTITEQT